MHRKRSYLLKSRADFAGYTPAKELAAYGFSQLDLGRVFPVKLGFLSLGGSLHQSDWEQSAAKWGLSPPNVTTLVGHGAGFSPDPQGADVENALDLEWLAGIWTAGTGLVADVTAYSATNDDIGPPMAIRDMVARGVEVISYSWGAPEQRYTSSALEALRSAIQYAQSRGCWFVCASGDASEDDGTNQLTVDCPACFPESWSVGGTYMMPLGASTERAWGDGRPGDSGGGGGFSAIYGKPAYQDGLFKEVNRGCPDSSAIADPATGAQVLCNGQWSLVGGTSWAAPVTAAILGIWRGILKQRGLPIPNDPHQLLYGNRATAFNDIVLGSNGAPATSGWDAATGLGSPNPKLWQVVPGNPPMPQPPIPPPVTTPIVQGIDPVALKGAVDAWFAKVEAANNRNAVVNIPSLLRQVNRNIDGLIDKIASHTQFELQYLDTLWIPQ